MKTATLLHFVAFILTVRFAGWNALKSAVIVADCESPTSARGRDLIVWSSAYGTNYKIGFELHYYIFALFLIRLAI